MRRYTTLGNSNVCAVYAGALSCWNINLPSCHCQKPEFYQTANHSSKFHRVPDWRIAKRCCPISTRRLLPSTIDWTSFVCEEGFFFFAPTSLFFVAADAYSQSLCKFLVYYSSSFCTSAPVRQYKRHHVFRSSVCVCACVRPFVISFLLYVWYALMDFHQTFFQ